MPQDFSPGSVMLPEFQTPEQVILHGIARFQSHGTPAMATCFLRDNLACLIVVADMQQIAGFSRILSAVGQTPLVKMPGY